MRSPPRSRRRIAGWCSFLQARPRSPRPSCTRTAPRHSCAGAGVISSRWIRTSGPGVRTVSSGRAISRWRWARRWLRADAWYCNVISIRVRRYGSCRLNASACRSVGLISGRDWSPIRVERGRLELSALRGRAVADAPSSHRQVRLAGTMSAYGSTETFTLVTVHPSGTPVEVAADNHGVPLPGNTIRIIDPMSGRVLPETRPARSPSRVPL